MSPRASAALTPEFNEEEVAVRGVTYRFRELSIGDYDELVKKATTTKVNQITGEQEETVDNSVLLKLMVTKCSVDPKITPEILAGLPMRVVLKLNTTVNRMHYGDEPDVEVAPKPVEDGEEPAPGND